jgi:two-component system phosphate regulon sensor histidine kinase PhoR
LRTIGNFEIESDSIKIVHLGELRSLTSKIVVSLSSDSLRLRSIDSLFSEELNTKNIDVNFELAHSFDEILKHRHSQDSVYEEKGEIKLNASSPFLPPHTTLTVTFSNSTKELFKRSMLGILISSLLVFAVIGCLIYLLKIINNQKQLAEIKNDLISNITHEFKTPIATIGVAVEGIRNFEVIKDKEKTKSYLDMSKQQLNKLNTMVEKLLETATLDSESLSLHKSETDINQLIELIVKKHILVNSHKAINTNLFQGSTIVNIDEFHIENALNNIIDNAVKYGGDEINISTYNENNNLVVEISDNGKTLKKKDKERIFEKFYRVPKGNTHDIKGFGIGLYYAKKVIEKHNGSITLDLSKKITTFRIKLPNG